MPDENGVPTLEEELQRLKAANRALIEEFSNPDNASESPEKVRDAFFPHVPDAVQQIVTLAQYGESEAIRMNASKYIIDIVVGKKIPIDPNDKEFKKLLQELGVQVT